MTMTVPNRSRRVPGAFAFWVMTQLHRIFPRRLQPS